MTSSISLQLHKIYNISLCANFCQIGRWVNGNNTAACSLYTFILYSAYAAYGPTTDAYCMKKRINKNLSEAVAAHIGDIIHRAVSHCPEQSNDR